MIFHNLRTYTFNLGAEIKPVILKIRMQEVLRLYLVSSPPTQCAALLATTSTYIHIE